MVVVILFKNLPMKENGKLVSVLNQLVRINKDRIEGYQLAAKEIDDPELKSLFNKYANDSIGYRDELVNDVSSMGGEAAEDTTVSGKAYRVWMEAKATVTGRDRKAILSSCEFGEDAALEAYDDAL